MFKQDFPFANEAANVIIDEGNELYYMGFYTHYPHEFVLADDEDVQLYIFEPTT